MQYVDDFRNADHVRALADSTGKLAAKLTNPVKFMEVCGGHTMAIHRFGLPELLPDSVELVSGPGCPVCVTTPGYIDATIDMARKGTIVTTFGDLYRVPGTKGTLEEAAADGGEVQVVYSPRDALAIATENPHRTVVFAAVGFETTAPAVAATIMEAQAAEVDNFHILSGHKTMPGALRAIVEAPEVELDGFLLPGHVSTITGSGIYEFIPEEFSLPCCIAGFEPADMLQAVKSLLHQHVEGGAMVDNAYGRAVRPEGNPTAWQTVTEVFKATDTAWRGLGMIPDTGLDLRDDWRRYRAEAQYDAGECEDPAGCRCGDVLRGMIRPPECPLFADACRPESPIGPCMVSSEGSCAAYFKYGSQ
ncbi:MAG: hydrogenase formation protein HypD [Planctomycetota bacterium]